jgi:hypothetical protein
MATTYTLISSVTVGSGGAANIEFTSIPADYTDLCVKLSLRTTADNSYFMEQVYMQFNNHTTSGDYAFVNLITYTGSSIESDKSNSSNKFYVDLAPCSTATSNTFSNSEVYIPNYTSSNYKSISIDRVAENNNSLSWLSFQAAIYNKTNVISSVKIVPNQGFNFVQYSTAYLYGISNA